MPGKIVDDSADLVPLPISVVTLSKIMEGIVYVVPETMSQVFPKHESWILSVAGENPIFDIARVVTFIPERMPAWTSGNFDFSTEYNAGDNLRPGDVPCVILGPGWEGRSDELYWAIARKLVQDERDPMMRMSIEAMMICHGRK